ncbi:hypothetical protein NKF26_12065 [Haladaptatus sp. AB618]|uniref:hypothetical protein n=1 Tax=Haladaptatus sp. AB618 TaxID=2934173 RepID=UPI00209BCE3E|nr:hypothetical protein [Haladaptatus sp. AB618]MCO8254538.1 hypothetical protein [Haladaptatus sp. AB618]
MSKSSRSTLKSHVTEELITYLGSGVLNTDQYAETIDYSGLNIQDFDQLKKLHFVLYEDVVRYIEEIPEHLRRIKTVTNQQEETVYGEVRGSVNWKMTTQQRASTGYNDPSLFVVNSSEVEYDIPENRVVKKFLAAVAEPLTNDIEAIDQEWRNMWDDRDIIELQQILAHNIYLDALPSPEEIHLSDRDLTAARRSRHQLYTESHRLYQLYVDLMNDRFDLHPVRELLSKTIVAPTKNHKLFELFCIFGVIRQIQKRYPSLELRRIEPGMETIALLEGPDYRIEVYYDQNGPLKFFESYPTLEEIEGRDVPMMMKRHAKALESQEQAIDDFLSKSSRHSFYSGRPDFVVLAYKKPNEESGNDEESLTDVIIGEVKYTRSETTFSQGLREVLEYLYFAREADQYLFNNLSQECRISGLLCTDGVSTETQSSQSVTHLTTEDLSELF